MSSFRSRFRLPRGRQSSLRMQSQERVWHIFHPHPDHPIVIAEFGDAAMLAIDVVDTPAEREVLVLLDEQRHVTAMLLDPPGELGLLVGMFTGPGLEVPFCQTIDILIDPFGLAPGAPTDDDRRGYDSLRAIHMLQGLLLLDVLRTDGDSVRSLAIGCDPDPVWFDEFHPVA
jgi:hypothetical protein